MGEETNRSVLNHLYQIGRVMRRPGEDIDNVNELTVLQMHALLYVKSNSPCRVLQLAEDLKISASSASLLVDRLVSLGKLEREQDEQDRRVVWLRLSKQAGQKLEAIINKRCAYMDDALGKLPSKDVQELERILGALEVALNETAK